MNYHISVLRQAILDAFSAEEQYHDHIVNKAKKIADPRICGGAEGWRRWYEVYQKESDCKWEALSLMCRMIDVDMKTACAIEKSIRRNSQYHLGWQREAHLAWDQDGSYRSAVMNPDAKVGCHYLFTGR